MKFFVTGATGFIGSHFLNAALAGGHEVVALRRSRQSASRVPFLSGKEIQLRWVEGSLDSVRADDLAGIDVLMHLAAGGVTPQPATWESCYRTNVADSLALAERAIDAGISRLVVTGTYAEYGLAGLRFDPIPPDAPLEPTDPYAASKASASLALAALCRVRKCELVYYRVFSVFGEGQFEQNFWPQLRRAAMAGEDFPMTEGDQVRDFLPVSDAAAILLRAASREDVEPGVPCIRNLASGRPVRLRDFAAECWAEFGATGQLRPGAIPSRPNEVKRYVPQVDPIDTLVGR